MRARWIVGFLVALAPSVARAYPELAMREGARRCNACHFSPAGGGLLNGYGRDEAGDALSRGGDGSFLYGAVNLPGWLALGGELRAAALAYDDTGATEGFEAAAFPMQADLRARAARGPWSFSAAAGLRGSTRMYQRAPTSWFISQEHWAMWRPSPRGAYVRAGRFFPVQGLRLPDHSLYVRKMTGVGLFEEPYGAAAGWIQDGWELHASFFVHDPLVDVGRRELGGVLHFETHGESWMAGLSLRGGQGDEGFRGVGGLSARLRVGGLVFLGEADAIRYQIEGSGASVNQLAAYLGADLRLVQGLQLAVWGEELQDTLGTLAAARHAAGAAIKWYPRAHWEVILEARGQLAADQGADGLGMLQVHFYL